MQCPRDRWCVLHACTGNRWPSCKQKDELGPLTLELSTPKAYDPSARETLVIFMSRAVRLIHSRTDYYGC